MSILIEVVLVDGREDIVTLEEAEELKNSGGLAPAVDDNLALTIEKFWGPDYGS